MTSKETSVNQLNAPLKAYVHQIISEFDQIPEERQSILAELALHVTTKHASGKPARLIFICTHNSRRSHMSQLWTQAAAYYYGVKDVETYSGGTEATAFNPRAVKAMKKAGFGIKILQEGDNPIYAVAFAEDASNIEVFSKKYDHEVNPQQDFAAIMTCSEADKSCPFIPGASLRIPIPYDDPKDYDETDQEETMYDERCHQIAREMFFMMSKVQV
ncbi:arsenate reductase/protein-tyrosine-phosphatase family protein [Catalinimonas niigatensis]|uniref:arsenate reductase/protein-tyrosine-phosphatase family protein n=1 Tax=Catalinimonas niigatensis TaxID=1397264 RepID=UPI002666CCA6|nr:protein-tyrosine-phosphatase [Catalinimonas niigatensis]WPP48024.1 protein-tyrosine-phosphatase [Catalinimonas niigatensis]